MVSHPNRTVPPVRFCSARLYTRRVFVRYSAGRHQVSISRTLRESTRHWGPSRLRQALGEVKSSTPPPVTDYSSVGQGRHAEIHPLQLAAPASIRSRVLNSLLPLALQSGYPTTSVWAFPANSKLRHPRACPDISDVHESGVVPLKRDSLEAMQCPDSASFTQVNGAQQDHLLPLGEMQPPLPPPPTSSEADHRRPDRGRVTAGRSHDRADARQARTVRPRAGP